MSARHGLFVCPDCRDKPGDDCSDACGMPFPDELPPVAFDYWPRCACCGERAELVAPLVEEKT